MNDKHYIELVEKFLEIRHKDYPTSGELLAYQRGLLTRFIVDLCKDDFYALGKLQRIIKEESKRK